MAASVAMQVIRAAERRWNGGLAASAWLPVALGLVVAVVCLPAGLGGYDLPVQLPGSPVRVRWPLKPPTPRPEGGPNGGLYLHFSAFTTTPTRKPILISIELVNGRGDWYQTARNLAIGFNQPRDIVLDMNGDSADWIPAGHFRPWDAAALEGMTALDCRVSASEPVDLVVQLTPPSWHSGVAPLPASAAVHLLGFDARRQCWRVRPEGAVTGLQVRLGGGGSGYGGGGGPVAAWPRLRFAPGPIAGEWHPVGAPEFGWRMPAGGAAAAGEVTYDLVFGEAQRLGVTVPLPDAAAAGPILSPRSPSTSGTAPGGPAESGGAEDITAPSGAQMRQRWGAGLAQLQVGGRLLVAASGPDPELTGQPAHWRVYSQSGWTEPAGAGAGAEAMGGEWAWRAPNFLADGVALQAAVAGRSPAGWLDPRVAWAWEEALLAAEKLRIRLPAVVWADRDLYEFGANRWGLNPWRTTVRSPRLLLAQPAARAQQRAVFAEMLARFAGLGVADWQVALTLPLQGETELADCFCPAAGELPPAVRIAISHPAGMGERPPLWAWTSGTPNWSYPAGWRSVFDPRRYAMLASTVTSDFVLIAAPAAGAAEPGRRGREGAADPPAARLIFRADPNARDDAGRFADNLAGGAYLDLDIESVGLGVDGRVAIDVVTGDWVRYHALSPELLPGNQRTRVRFALDDFSPLKPAQCDLAPDWIATLPADRQPAWRGYRMRRIREIVVNFYRASGPVQARLYGMAIYPTRPGDAQTPSAVKPLTVALPKTQAAGQLLELDAEVKPAPLNPYDLEEVDLRLAVVGESGAALEIPAFWLEPTSRGTRAVKVGGKEIDAEQMLPEGVGRFRARLRLPQAGRYRLEWRLYRNNHFETTAVKVHDYRFSETGVAEAFPRKDYMEGALLADNRALGRGPKLYGATEPNRPVERLRYVDGAVAARADLGDLTVAVDAATPAPKYVRIAAGDPEQFEFSDGSSYYPIGVNARSPSDGRVPFKEVPGRERYDANFFTALDLRATRQFDDYFAAYATHGINWARVWMSSWWLALEWRRDFPGFGGVGDYNQVHAARLDHLVAEAERRGIYLQITLNNHGMVSPEIDTQWADNPYNADLGGPCASMLDFFSRAAPQQAHFMRLRYIVARWGQSPAIHGWEIFSEVEFVGEYAPHYFDHERGLKGRSAAVLDDWHRDVAQWLKRWDVLGRHLVTTHYSHPYQGQSTLAMKEMEVPMANAYSAYPDLYSDAGDPKNNTRADIAADAYYNGFRDPNSKGVFAGFKQYRKPVLVGEHGRHWMGVDMRYRVGTPNTPDNLEADMHCMLWAMYMRPYAGNTGFWWWLPLQFEAGWLDHYAAFAAFSAGEDRRGRKWDSFDGRCDRDALGCMGLYDTAAGRGFAWVFEKSIEQNLRQGTMQSGATVNLPLKMAGRYEVEFWHTRRPGPAVPPTPATPGGAGAVDPAALRFETRQVELPEGQAELKLLLPKFTGDLALKIRRVDGGARK